MGCGCRVGPYIWIGGERGGWEGDGGGGHIRLNPLGRWDVDPGGYVWIGGGRRVGLSMLCHHTHLNNSRTTSTLRTHTHTHTHTNNLSLSLLCFKRVFLVFLTVFQSCLTVLHPPQLKVNNTHTKVDTTHTNNHFLSLSLPSNFSFLTVLQPPQLKVNNTLLKWISHTQTITFFLSLCLSLSCTHTAAPT